MKASGEKGIVTVLLVFLSLALLALFLAQSTVHLRREKRENTYVQTARLAAAEFKVPFPLVLAVIRTESDFRPNAVSDAGACGLMQIMPETFEWLQTLSDSEVTHSESELFNPEINIKYGTYYLSYLIDHYNGREELAVAAYNGGFANVDSWLEDERYSDDGITLTEIPYNETSQYVERVENTKSMYESLYYDNN